MHQTAQHTTHQHDEHADHEHHDHSHHVDQFRRLFWVMVVVGIPVVVFNPCLLTFWATTYRIVPGYGGYRRSWEALSTSGADNHF